MIDERTPLHRASMAVSDSHYPRNPTSSSSISSTTTRTRRASVVAVCAALLVIVSVVYVGTRQPPTTAPASSASASVATIVTTDSSERIRKQQLSSSTPQQQQQRFKSLPSVNAAEAPAGNIDLLLNQQQQHARARDDSDDEYDSEGDRVRFVPGYGTPLEKQYAGLLHVNAQADGKLFYWFFEARPTGSFSSTSEKTPLLIWLNGGPGASSMTGLLTEMGPYRMLRNGRLIPHPQSWTQLGHMLFLDQPVGTGYSSVRDDSGFVNTQDEAAAQVYEALQQFYRLHPEYATNPVFICGESYAGKYVPHIAHYIMKQQPNDDLDDDEDADITIPLAGVAIGNGMMWPVLQTRSVPDYAIALGLIDSQQYERANADISVCEEFHRQGRHVDAFQVCQSVTDSIYDSAGNPFVYDIRARGNPFADMTTMMASYFNSDVVRDALHVPRGTVWRSVDGSSYGVAADAPAIARHLLADEMLDVPIGTFRELLDKYKFLFYAGNMDGSACNNLGVSRMIDRLAWTATVEYRAAPRRPWRVDGHVAGLAKSAGNMSFVVVLNSGHLVPTDQPAAALDMMRRFLNDVAFDEEDETKAATTAA